MPCEPRFSDKNNKSHQSHRNSHQHISHRSIPIIIKKWFGLNLTSSTTPPFSYHDYSSPPRTSTQHHHYTLLKRYESLSRHHTETPTPTTTHGTIQHGRPVCGRKGDAARQGERRQHGQRPHGGVEDVGELARQMLERAPHLGVCTGQRHGDPGIAPGRSDPLLVAIMTIQHCTGIQTAQISILCPA